MIVRLGRASRGGAAAPGEGADDVRAASTRCGPLLGAALLGLWALLGPSRFGLARPADVVRRVATGPIARLVLVLVVMFAGWHFFAR